VNVPVLSIGQAQPPPGVAIQDVGWRHAALAYGWSNPATTLVLQHTDDLYAIYGLILPVDSNGRPASDVAQSLFNASWVAPSTLASYGFVFTNDWAPQSVNSTYYDVQPDYPINDEGVLVGNWPPSLLTSSQLNDFNDVVGGVLCAYNGSMPAIDHCGPDNPAVYENQWQSQFGRPYLTSPNGNVTGAAYLQQMQTCAAAYTGKDGVDACLYFEGPNPYYDAWNNPAATTYWTGPIGK
jgi:hypothetical protein